MPEGGKATAFRISIHSPLRGETCTAESNSHPPFDFNPLASERRDAMPANLSSTLPYFNPLASERRDQRQAIQPRRRKNFNPLASERRDRGKPKMATASAYFNPLASERRDGHVDRCTVQMGDFNPLASERRDRALNAHINKMECISIHSPLRGETKSLKGKDYGYTISIHSPLRGETPASSTTSSRWPFQSTRL